MQKSEFFYFLKISTLEFGITIYAVFVMFTVIC
jgi:hypothetical protein